MIRRVAPGPCACYSSCPQPDVSMAPSFIRPQFFLQNSCSLLSGVCGFGLGLCLRLGKAAVLGATHPDTPALLHARLARAPIFRDLATSPVAAVGAIAPIFLLALALVLDAFPG